MNELLLAPEPKDKSLLAEGNFEHALRVASMMSKSMMVPKAFQGKPQDILLAMEYGRCLGLGQLQAVQNIAVINGRPSMWGDAVLAVCQSHFDCEYITEKPIKDDSGNITGYICTAKRRSYPEPKESTFTIEDAKRAGLWGRNTWAQYPSRMLQLRARGFALRDTFADALSGIQIKEEQDDAEVSNELKNITPVEDAKLELKQLIEKNKPKEDKKDGS